LGLPGEKGPAWPSVTVKSAPLAGIPSSPSSLGLGWFCRPSDPCRRPFAEHLTAGGPDRGMSSMILERPGRMPRANRPRASSRGSGRRHQGTGSDRGPQQRPHCFMADGCNSACPDPRLAPSDSRSTTWPPDQSQEHRRPEKLHQPPSGAAPPARHRRLRRATHLEGAGEQGNQRQDGGWLRRTAIVMVGRPRRRSSLSMAGRSSWNQQEWCGPSPGPPAVGKGQGQLSSASKFTAGQAEDRAQALAAGQQGVAASPPAVTPAAPVRGAPSQGQHSTRKREAPR